MGDLCAHKGFVRPCYGAKQVLVCSIICIGLLFKASTWSVHLYFSSVLHPKLKCCPKLNFRLSNIVCIYRTYYHSSHTILPLCISCTVGPKECAILIFCPLKTTTLPPSLFVKGGREGGLLELQAPRPHCSPRAFPATRFYRSEQRFTIGCNQSLCTLVNQWEVINGSPTNNYRVFYFLHSRADAEVGLHGSSQRSEFTHQSVSVRNPKCWVCVGRVTCPANLIHTFICSAKISTYWCLFKKQQRHFRSRSTLSCLLCVCMMDFQSPNKRLIKRKCADYIH